MSRRFVGIRVGLWLAMASSLALAGAARSKPAKYRFQLLAAPANVIGNVDVARINQQGIAAGSYFVPSGAIATAYACVWQPGTGGYQVFTLPEQLTIGGTEATESPLRTVASSISDDGVVVGYCWVGSNSNPTTHACFWVPGPGGYRGFDVHALLTGGQASIVGTSFYDLNANHEAIGQATLAGGGFRVFYTRLGLGGTASPVLLLRDSVDDTASTFGGRINAAGMIVGTGGASSHALLWTDAGTGTPVAHNLGVNVAQSAATALNENGTAVGSFAAKPGAKAPIHAFILPNAESATVSAKSDLGVLPGFPLAAAADINSLGVAVGDLGKSTKKSVSLRACVWPTPHHPIDLTLHTSGIPSGHKMWVATGINDAGTIIGTGQDSGGHTFSFALAPPAK